MEVKLGEMKRYMDIAVGEIFKIKLKDDEYALCIKTAIESPINNRKWSVRLDTGTDLTPMDEDVVRVVKARILTEG